MDPLTLPLIPAITEMWITETGNPQVEMPPVTSIQVTEQETPKEETPKTRPCGIRIKPLSELLAHPPEGFNNTKTFLSQTASPSEEKKGGETDTGTDEEMEEPFDTSITPEPVSAPTPKIPEYLDQPGPSGITIKQRGSGADPVDLRTWQKQQQPAQNLRAGPSARQRLEDLIKEWNGPTLSIPATKTQAAQTIPLGIQGRPIYNSLQGHQGLSGSASRLHSLLQPAQPRPPIPDLIPAPASSPWIPPSPYTLRPLSPHNRLQLSTPNLSMPPPPPRQPLPTLVPTRPLNNPNPVEAHRTQNPNFQAQNPSNGPTMATHFGLPANKASIVPLQTAQWLRSHQHLGQLKGLLTTACMLIDKIGLELPRAVAMYDYQPIFSGSGNN